MHTVAETPTFSLQTAKLFSECEKLQLTDRMAEHPLAGDEIPGTGGVRKMRFSASGRGKRGGVRVIYFYGGERVPVYALLAYAKAAKTDLSPRERRRPSPQLSGVRETRGNERLRRRPDPVPERSPGPREG